MGVSKNKATPKWMVYNGKNPINPWMIWGENPLFSETSLCTTNVLERTSFRSIFTLACHVALAKEICLNIAWLTLKQWGTGRASEERVSNSMAINQPGSEVCMYIYMQLLTQWRSFYSPEFCVSEVKLNYSKTTKPSQQPNQAGVRAH